jgi:hypothetical protein
MPENMNWTCPYCDRDQVITNNRSRDLRTLYPHESAISKLGLIAQHSVAITCANPSCRKLTLSYTLWQITGYNEEGGPVVGEKLHQWQLLPTSGARPQPDYIPEAIRNDYVEACKIQDLSSKASAAIARRCLQGIIRDFCGITKDRLIDEIEELRRQVDKGNGPFGVQPDTVDAIDTVRSIGNIGAHMELDVNLIVDIDPGEARTLIGLIELLFREWYVARKVRQDRLHDLAKIAGVKEIVRKGPAPIALPAPDAPTEAIKGS